MKDMREVAGYTGGALLLAGLALAALSAGCGHRESPVGDQASTPASTVTAQTASVEPEGSGAGSTASSLPSEGDVSDQYAASPDVVPPDVSASAADTLVSRGGIVEVTAQGSPDVEEVVLWDGIGKKQPLAYDMQAKVWRAFYRVPVSAQIQRVALSVTARNAAHKWRRVWIFLSLETEHVSAEPDSSSLR
jgi:hypothetical protein